MLSDVTTKTLEDLEEWSWWQEQLAEEIVVNLTFVLRRPYKSVNNSSWDVIILGHHWFWLLQKSSDCVLPSDSINFATEVTQASHWNLKLVRKRPEICRFVMKILKI